MNLKRFVLPIAALVVLVAPGIAGAQSQSCYYFYCESFASWAPEYNQIQGYSRMSDWYYGVEMEVDGYVDDPDLGWIYLGFAYGTWEVVIDEYYWGAKPGPYCYYTGAYNYYLWGSPGWWWYDGDSTSNPVCVPYPHPTGDFTSYHYNLNDPGRYTALFVQTLTPQGPDYDGGWVQESLSGFYESCKPQVPGSPITLLPPDEHGVPVMQGNFEDSVGTPEVWVDYYSALIQQAQIAPCGWQTFQTVSYEGVPYSIGVVSGQDIDGFRVDTFRAGITISQDWRGD